MRRVVSVNSARHCSSVASFSAASTTFFTMAFLTGTEWSELTRPSKILSMIYISSVMVLVAGEASRVEHPRQPSSQPPPPAPLAGPQGVPGPELFCF
uniref:Uncharacterized protein n=1 Tax=Nothobranchius furzeri TaxID=105023 RepID=A0A8C6KKK9_NOTFU